MSKEKQGKSKAKITGYSADNSVPLTNRQSGPIVSVSNTIKPPRRPSGGGGQSNGQGSDGKK